MRHRNESGRSLRVFAAADSAQPGYDRRADAGDPPARGTRRFAVADSVYKIIELVGTSTDSWERAAASAVERASGTLRDLRVAEVSELDMTVEDGKVVLYRAKIKLSFKYEEA
jgi:flavin-binding protein dodecin